MKNFVLNAARFDENMEQSYQWYLQGVCRIRAFFEKKHQTGFNWFKKSRTNLLLSFRLADNTHSLCYK